MTPRLTIVIFIPDPRERHRTWPPSDQNGGRLHVGAVAGITSECPAGAIGIRTDRGLASAVAAHKAMFFAERDAARTPIDYSAAVSGGLTLVPEGAARDVLADDYVRMIEDGLLLDEAEDFDALMARCADIAARANVAAGQ